MTKIIEAGGPGSGWFTEDGHVSHLGPREPKVKVSLKHKTVFDTPPATNPKAYDLLKQYGYKYIGTGPNGDLWTKNGVAVKGNPHFIINNEKWMVKNAPAAKVSNAGLSTQYLKYKLEEMHPSVEQKLKEAEDHVKQALEKAPVKETTTQSAYKQSLAKAQTSEQKASITALQQHGWLYVGNGSTDVGVQLYSKMVAGNLKNGNSIYVKPNGGWEHFSEGKTQGKGAGFTSLSVHLDSLDKATPPLGSKTSETSKIIDVSDWKQVGKQLGSNPGGTYKDPKTGDEYYIKFPQKDVAQAKSEVLANSIYNALDIPAPKAKLAQANGEIGVASPMIKGERLTPEDMASSPGVRIGRVADAYLANWDVFGLAHDNIIQSYNTSEAYRIDNGGAMFYKAQGGDKPFPADKVDELESMVAPDKQGSKIYGDVGLETQKAQAEKLVERLTDDKLEKLVKAAGFEGKEADKYLTALKGRRDVIAEKYGIGGKSSTTDVAPTDKTSAKEADHEQILKEHGFSEGVKVKGFSGYNTQYTNASDGTKITLFNDNSWAHYNKNGGTLELGNNLQDLKDYADKLPKNAASSNIGTLLDQGYNETTTKATGLQKFVKDADAFYVDKESGFWIHYNHGSQIADTDTSDGKSIKEYLASKPKTSGDVIAKTMVEHLASNGWKEKSDVTFIQPGDKYFTKGSNGSVTVHPDGTWEAWQGGNKQTEGGSIDSLMEHIGTKSNDNDYVPTKSAPIVPKDTSKNPWSYEAAAQKISELLTKYKSNTTDTFYSADKMSEWSKAIPYGDTSQDALIKAAEGKGIYAEAAAHFNLRPSDVRDAMDMIDNWTGSSSQYLRDEFGKVAEKASDANKVLVLEKELTQQQLKKLYPEGTVRIYRGIKPSENLPPSEYKKVEFLKIMADPNIGITVDGDWKIGFKNWKADSWSDDLNTAKSFGSHGIVITNDTPIDHVLTSYKTNPSVFQTFKHEHEFVVAPPHSEYLLDSKHSSVMLAAGETDTSWVADVLSGKVKLPGVGVDQDKKIIWFDISTLDPDWLHHIRPVKAEGTQGKWKLEDEYDFQGMHICIENKKGSVRSGTEPNGKPWSIKMPFDYGYVKGTEGTDGDEVDCFIGPDKEAKYVYVVHQRTNDQKKEYDEDKCMIGFSSPDEAKKAYHSAYNNVDLFTSMSMMTVDEFKKKLKEFAGDKIHAALCASSLQTSSTEYYMAALYLMTSVCIEAGGPGSGRHPWGRKPKPEPKGRTKKALPPAASKLKTLDKLNPIRNQRVQTPEQLKKRESELARIRKEQGDQRKANQAKGLNVHGKEILSAKQAIAVKNAVIADKSTQDLAEKAEQMVTKFLKAEQSKNDAPVDVQLKVGHTLYGIEVKSLILQNNDKITMKRDAVQRKLNWAAENKGKLATLAVDFRGTKLSVYYREGVGAFRLGKMQKVSGGLKGLSAIFNN